MHLNAHSTINLAVNTYNTIDSSIHQLLEKLESTVLQHRWLRPGNGSWSTSPVAAKCAGFTVKWEVSIAYRQ